MGVRTNILDAKEKMQETTPAKTVSVTASTANNQSEPNEDGDKYKLSSYRRKKYQPWQLVQMSNTNPGGVGYSRMIQSVTPTGEDMFNQFGKPRPSLTEDLTAQQAVDRRLSELQRVGASAGEPFNERAAQRQIGVNWNEGMGYLRDTDNILDELDKYGIKDKNQAVAQIQDIVNNDPFLSKQWNSQLYNKDFPNWKLNLAEHYMKIKKERDEDMAKDTKAKKPTYSKTAYYANPDYTAPYMTEAERADMKKSPEKYKKDIEISEETKKKVGIGKKS